MEYESNNKINYTTLHIGSILVWNKWAKRNKKDTDANPPMGDGEWARKSLFQKWFYLLLVTESVNWNYHKLLGPSIGWNQDFTTLEKLWVFSENGDP